MRVNARLDDESQQQIDYLVSHTGQSVSHVLRESVARYYAEVRARKQGLRRFATVIGTGDSGRSDVATHYKEHLLEILEAKHGLPRR